MNREHFFMALVLIFFAILPVQAQNSPNNTIKDFSTILDTGYIIQDRNGDTVIDYVNTNIVIPDNPDETHIVCAANCAARLGYETSGTDLNLITSASSISIPSQIPLIGIDVIPGIPETGIKKISLSTAINGLTPGQGRIRFFSPEEVPYQGFLLITGKDQSGVIAAAHYFAGRYPDLWKLNGYTYSEVNEKFKKFLDQRAIDFSKITVNSCDVDAHKPGIIKLQLTITFDNNICFQKALESLKGNESPGEIEEKLTLADLEFNDVHKMEVKLISPLVSKTVYLFPQKPWETKISGKKSPSPQRYFSLWQLYSTDGILQDTNKDYIPDYMPAYISFSGKECANSTGNLAARIGLETAGIKIPLVRTAGEEEHPEQYGFPILYGADHYKINRLAEKNKIYSSTKFPDAGFIQFVTKAFDDKNGIVITGGNPEALNAISDYTARHLPYLWDYGKGNFQLKDIENDVKNFFQVRKAPGQVAFALDKLERWLKRLKGREIESFSVELAAEKTPAGLETVIHDMVKKHFCSAEIEITLHQTGFGKGKPVFKEQFEIPWEVDDFRVLFQEDILPQIHAESRGSIQVLVSESPEIRQTLKEEIEGELRLKGVSEGAIGVSVLCAYKQGYSWLYDEVLEKLRGKQVGNIEIVYHTLKDSKEIRWQTIHSPTRWLQELYPVDEILARKLDIPDSLISFHPTQKKNPIYTVKVHDKSGNHLLTETFSPKYVIRPLFDLFPEYESTRITTGWVTAEIDGNVVLDRRIKTDPEKFWDHLQSETYGKIVNHVMNIQEGQPSSDNAPYFDEFKINLTMSEPNYLIGLDEEVISSLEALHEDIYFHSLMLFNRIGGRYDAGGMNYAGRILPYIQPPVDGKPGEAIIEFTGKEQARPQLVMLYKEKGSESRKKRYYLDNLNVPDPRLTGIWVEPGKSSVAQLMFEVLAADSVDRYEEYKMRASERSIDRTFISIENLKNMVKILGSLHEKEIFSDELSYDKVDNMLFRIALEDSTEIAGYAGLSRSTKPKNTTNPQLTAGFYKYRGERLVQWKTPIGPCEAASVMAKLNTFPNVRAYYTKSSFLGQPVFAMDLFPPYETEYISQAKLNALKPTLFICGREHANEVSATGHILRMAELAATDTSYARYLKNVNLVLLPITNIDGAKTGVEMFKENPHFMLHAARYGPLGVDIARDNPHYPDTEIRPMLRETWLPDVYLNSHGYPSHEWVQYCAGYAAWVRSRRGGARSWWAPRGWFIPGFSWIEDKEYPNHKKVAFAILDSVAAAITSLPDMTEASKRMYNRYKKYNIQDKENFTEYFYKGVLVNAALKGRKMGPSRITGPRITYFSITTEAPDETAYGEWMETNCQAGLEYTAAVLRYLADGINRIEREVEEYEDGVCRSVYRKRPVLPPEKNEEKTNRNN